MTPRAVDQSLHTLLRANAATRAPNARRQEQLDRPMHAQAHTCMPDGRIQDEHDLLGLGLHATPCPPHRKRFTVPHTGAGNSKPCKNANQVTLTCPAFCIPSTISKNCGDGSPNTFTT
jgi:hypothetical protein